MILKQPLALVAHDDGKIGFNQAPANETERAILVGVLQRAVMAMSQMPLIQPGPVIQEATPAASAALASMLMRGNGR